MLLKLAHLPILALAALTAAAKQTRLATNPVASEFKPDGLSAYHPVDISSSQKPSGTWLRAVHTYTLYVDSSRSGRASYDSWVVGVKGQQGWLEAEQIIGERSVMHELTEVGQVE